MGAFFAIPKGFGFLIKIDDILVWLRTLAQVLILFGRMHTIIDVLNHQARVEALDELLYSFTTPT